MKRLFTLLAGFSVAFLGGYYSVGYGTWLIAVGISGALPFMAIAMSWECPR